MLIPHNNSKAFELSSKRGEFVKKINSVLDTDGTTTEIKNILINIRDSHDLSVGTPPINSYHIDFMSQIQLGGHVRDLRKYRDVIGVTGDINEAHWNYLMDTLEQMISQSTHYTTKAEICDFLHRSKWAVNFKGMNGMIRTVVSGNADKAVSLLRGDVFSKDCVVVMESPAPELLYEKMTADTTSVFVVKVKHARINHYAGEKWFPLLTRLVIVDDSKESRSSNTSLIFCFHNGIINTLNKVHTKKLGSPSNTQLNLRLILENVNPTYLKEFREKIEAQIGEYAAELETLLNEQTGGPNDIEKRITLFKLDSFSRQVVQDKYSLEKLRDFIFFLENCHKQETKKVQTQELIDEFESRMKNYFYAGNKLIDVITILEGGGRHQIKTFGDYLRSKTFNNLNSKIRYACQLILDIIPSCYERTLHNHFHKNFGINLFLEKYQEYLTKTGKDADNKGRFEKFLIDLGIRDKYFALKEEDKEIVKNFLAALGNLDQTSVSDAVQMIIRDLLFNLNGRPKPYIIYNAIQAWEYKDLLPDDCFDINPFDIEIENDNEGRLAYDRLIDRLQRIKSTLALFDDSGSLWDLFLRKYDDHRQKNFRHESLTRMKMAKEIGQRLLDNSPAGTALRVIQSDGSYLFNFKITGPYPYPDLLLFCQMLARNKGVATVPYPTGLVRFSLGGYTSASKEGLKVLGAELEDAFSIFIRYWNQFAAMRADSANKERESSALLNEMFRYPKDKDFIESIIADYPLSAKYKKDKAPSLQIRDVRSLYHASPEKSGVTITTIGRSANSVIELHGDIVGTCKDVFEFVRSSAFTKIYENLLAQVYKRVPALADLDFNTVSSKYSKAVILKYITNKRTFQPNHHVLDNPEEKSVMMEILIEMENLLFSDSKMKILAINATGSPELDKAKLEGLNSIIKKYIREILLHFNLPFEKESLEPSRREIIQMAGACFEEITGIKLLQLNLNIWIDEFMRTLRDKEEFRNLAISQKSIGYIEDVLRTGVDRAAEITDKILYLYLLENDKSFYKMVCDKLAYFDKRISDCDDTEVRMLTEEFVSSIMPMQLQELSNYIMRKKDIKIAESEIYAVSRRVVRFYISLIKRTRGTDYYNRYAHTIVRIVETAFKKQNSSVNEMVQHGISIYKGFEMENKSLETFAGGRINWINELMTKCGVISSEQPVQEHTRIVTDAKKREYPFHKIDRVESKKPDGEIPSDYPAEYIRYIDLRPDPSFFVHRLARFVANMDSDDYRCKVVKHGIVKELVIFQKGYLKYLTDNYRLNYTEDISLQDIRNFVPDVISLLGAPEKLISFPQIGYFDIKGPAGNIKTIVTPLKSEADYFGDVKKPRLTVINEKVKEMGGTPRHGSLFMVEENDGSVFVIEINGDSGVGKSEMIAAFVLKWLRNNLEGIRSVKMVAGDMFHEFQDADGNLYGIGTEVGDFSRTTDFDPDYIKYYKYLFESSADSNVDDRNARSTVSGMCDITMPYKVDIMLSASNYSKNEGGITRIDNPENFLLYIDAHGERKEKATSGDGPNFQCTLKRYTADKNIVEVISRHGNYLDDILDWDFSPADQQYYLASSFKLLDKIDITEVVKMIFAGRSFTRDGVAYTIENVAFDMIQNRFIATVSYRFGDDRLTDEKQIDRKMFSAIFDALASTPGGQPFISEEGQVECIHNLITCLRGGKDGKGGARHIQCGVLSTEIGKKGREITGPQKAAAALKQLIQEVRVNKPEINEGKIKVKRLLNEKYRHLFHGEMNSSELWRYNFYLYQLDNMRKADLRRMDNKSKKVDITNLVNFHPSDPNHEFSPLLVNPNLNIELTSFGETFEELMSFPNYPDFAEEFAAKVPTLYIAEGYSEETNINNMIVQLLMLEGYISSDDLARGSVIEKVNRETIAAAKYAVVQYLNSLKKQGSEPAAAKPENDKTALKTVTKPGPKHCVESAANTFA